MNEAVRSRTRQLVETMRARSVRGRRRDTSGGEPPQRFFLVHMQKTAGTTLRHRFLHHFEEDAVFPNRTDGGLRTAVISVSNLLERWSVRGDEIRLVAGHFPLHTTEMIGVPFTTMTVLRPPVERTLSFLRHQKKIYPEDRKKSLDEVYADPFRFNGLVRNHMVRMLSLRPDEMKPGDGALTDVAYTSERLELAKEGLASVDAFGLQSHFEEFCTELTVRFGVDLGPPLNVNTTEPEETPAGLADRIAEDNALDMELYEYACRLYAERHPTSPAPDGVPR
jgi:hypothetical protein